MKTNVASNFKIEHNLEYHIFPCLNNTEVALKLKRKISRG